MFLTTQAQAQLSSGNHPPANAAGILGALPPDVYAKVQALAEILQQNIQEGKITDADIQRELMSGNLEQTIKSLNPEAGQLLDDISNAMKNGSGSENLSGLLGGLTGPTH